MGNCKDEMKKNEPVEKKTSKSLFSKLSKNKKGETKEEIAETFADYVCEAEKKLNGLIEKKQEELENESGREDYNRRALGRLQTMMFHLDSITEIASEYGEDN